MMILVTYDVSTTSSGGAKRLRHIAKNCQDYGQRVQFSVFEIEVDSAQWAMLKARLVDIIDQEVDSLRFYYLGNNWKTKVEHIGAKPALDLNDALLF